MSSPNPKSSPIDECEEQKRYERRESDKVLNAVCDRLEAQDDVLNKHTESLKNGAEQFELIKEQLDNHSMFMQDMMRLHQDAMQLHNIDVAEGKKMKDMIKKNSKSIENIEYAMQAQAKADAPMLEIMKEIKDATSVMGWFVKHWKAIALLISLGVTFVVDMWQQIIDLVRELMK